MEQSKRVIEEAKRVGQQYEEEAEKFGREYQHQAAKMGQQFQAAARMGFDAIFRSWSELSRGWTAMATEVNEYSKNVFNDANRAMEQLVGAKTLEDVFEIQNQYARRAYENHVAELSKLGKICAGVAEDAYRPVEQATRRRV